MRLSLLIKKPSGVLISTRPRRLNFTRKFSTAPPSPKPKPIETKIQTPTPSAKGDFSGNGFYILITAALVGAGAYFREEIMNTYNEYRTGQTTEKNPSPGAKVVPSASMDPLSTDAGVKEVRKVIEVAEKKLEPVIAAEKKEENLKAVEKQQVAALKKSSEADWKAVREEIVKILDNPKHDDGSYGPVLVRLAWHAAGTYDKKTGKGGTEGAAMRWDPEMSWGANKGLDKARAILEPIKQKFPDITYSDLWSYAGTVAIEEMGGPEMKWRPGRKDVLIGENVLPDGLLPDADGRDFKTEPAKHIKFVFNRMGFNDQEIVALLGAHALGRCHTQNSGYDGPWTRAPTTFSNQFFKLLTEEKWVKKSWDGPEQYENEGGKDLMMLPSDLALIKDAGLKKYVDLYAKDENKFFNDFAKAWMKLQENGVRKFHGWRRYIFFGPRE